MNFSSVVTLPTALTLVRLVCSPLIMPCILIYPFSAEWRGVRIIAASLFTLLSITDFFDGYIARRFSQESALGALLDPLADKALVFSTIISLLAIGRIALIPVMIIIGREFFIMGLREYAATEGIILAVTWEGKLKTALQFIYLFMLILCVDTQTHRIFMLIEYGLLLLTLFFTIYSAFLYYQSYLTQCAHL